MMNKNKFTKFIHLYLAATIVRPVENSIRTVRNDRITVAALLRNVVVHQ